MAELLRTNNPAILAIVEGLLTDAGIPHWVADRHMAVLEGSINAIQLRVLVPDEHEPEARAVLTEAELGSWLRR